MSGSERGKLGYLEATAIGIGGMVSGGIFAVLGLSVELVRGGAPLAFLLAGIGGKNAIPSPSSVPLRSCFIIPCNFR